MSITEKCKVEDCYGKGKLEKGGKRSLVRGYCLKHYSRLQKGIPLLKDTKFTARHAVKRGNTALIPVGVSGKDGFAIVDIDNANIDRHKWHMNNRGYPTARIDGSLVLMHHLIIGKPPKGLVTDHINRNKLDNRAANLRIVTQAINAQNSSRVYKNKLGLQNITEAKRSGAYLVRIVRSGKTAFRGVFDSLDGAVAARDDFLSNA